MGKYTRPGAKGKIAIKQDEPFIDALAGRDPRSLADFEKLLKDAEALVRSEYPAAQPNAIRKLRGDWYEAAIGLGALSYANQYQSKYCLINLPKITSFKVHNLYKSEIALLIDQLAEAVKDSADVSLISSNPDFAIVRSELISALPLTGFDMNTLKAVNTLYSQFAGQCDLDDVVGYTSVKTSLKPDRRLQIAHEGSLMKALYRHIQTRQWIIGAPGIRYFGITKKFGPADVKALKTVATHSIVDVLGKPESAVDKLYSVKDGAELEQILSEITIS